MIGWFELTNWDRQSPKPASLIADSPTWNLLYVFTSPPFPLWKWGQGLRLLPLPLWVCWMKTFSKSEMVFFTSLTAFQQVATKVYVNCVWVRQLYPCLEMQAVLLYRMWTACLVYLSKGSCHACFNLSDLHSWSSHQSWSLSLPLALGCVQWNV